MASKRKKKKQNVLQRFFSGIFPDRKSWSGEPYYDYNLLACVILLVSFGLVMLYSTSAYTAKVNYGSDMTFFAKQAGLSAVCILGMLFISRVDYHWIANWGAWLYLISNILLILTRFVGRNVKGADRTGSVPDCRDRQAGNHSFSSVRYRKARTEYKGLESTGNAGFPWGDHIRAHMEVYQ